MLQSEINLYFLSALRVVKSSGCGFSIVKIKKWIGFSISDMHGNQPAVRLLSQVCSHSSAVCWLGFFLPKPMGFIFTEGACGF